MKQDWETAGELAYRALQLGKKLIQENTTLLEVAQKIDEFIEKNNAIPGFPANISINEITAHYIPLNNEIKFKKGDLVKLDVGVCKNGAIGDCATTVSVGTENKLIQVSEEALDNAIKTAKPGVKISEIGKIIEQTAKKHNFKVIKNLSGHGLDEYQVHTEPTIPNYDNQDSTILKENQIIAIEPFITDGKDGLVREGKSSGIYQLINLKNTRNPLARKLLKEITEKFQTLPFSKRSLNTTDFALSILEKENIIKQYPVLIESSNGNVSQTEKTILITKEGNKILTK